MALNAPFRPTYGTGAAVSPAASSASITIDKESGALCLTNIGANVCYVRPWSSEDAAKDASVADYAIPPGAQVVITKGRADRLSHISPLGTTLHVMVGEGE